MIFCVEDDSSIRDLCVYTLEASGFEARGFCDGEELFSALSTVTPSLIMLDIMLPGEDGLSLLCRLRENPQTAHIPVIMATAKGSEFDAVRGLDLGADDYLSKPFGMMEMVSRIRAVLRRTAPKDGGRLSLCGITVDTVAHTALCDGKKLSLTLKEFELLSLLLRHPDRVFTRDELLSLVWGTDFAGETRTVDVHIGTLRTKLSTKGKHIATVRGVGYRMEEDV